MNYIKFTITSKKSIEQSYDIITAFLSEFGFESFEDFQNCIYAYIKKDYVNDNLIKNIQLLSKSYSFMFKFDEIFPQNWNKKWESNFDFIKINKDCIIRASFHKKNNIKYDIIIDPKMSFGTGHHETTFLMCQELFKINLKSKNVLDFGCGTGILSILSSKLGAKWVSAIDCSARCIQSCIENLKVNNIDNVKLIKDNMVPSNDKFDLVISNINRNVIVKSFKSFSETNAKEILLSGFLDEDFEILFNLIDKSDFTLKNKKTKNGWLMLRLKK